MARKTNEKKRIEQLLNRAAELSSQLQQVKSLYKELDEITNQMLEMEVLQASTDDYTMTMVDNFAEKNTAFRVARLNRFELKIEPKAPKVAMRKGKAKTGKWDFPTKKSRA